MTISRRLVLLLLLSLALAGCTGESLKPEQPALENTVILDSQNTAGQTFTAHYDGLNSLQVHLSPLEPGAGQVVLHLRSGLGESQDLRIAALPVTQVNQPGTYSFAFPALQDSNRKDYYALLEMEGDGRLGAGAAGGEAYLYGALYQNGQPQEAQLTFGLGYDRPAQLSGLVRESLSWALWLLAGLFLFMLPGWALLSVLWQGWDGLYFWERLGLATGASLAIYPLLFLWTGLVGLHLGALYAWLPPLAALGVIAWRYIRRSSITLRPPAYESRLAEWQSKRAGHLAETRQSSITLRLPTSMLYARLHSITWPDLALLAIIGLVFGVRFWVIRNLDLPLWGDSYQHTVIAQLLVDHNGLFNSWLPYAELTTFTYHFGFHSLAAVFHWVTGLDLPAAVLWTGQLLNGLAVVALIPLVMRIERSRWAALGAVTLAGTLALMPMAYTNWGRYTQLAGQAILPAAIYLIWSVLVQPPERRRDILAVWIVLGGLALTHYRVLILALCFYPAFILLNLRGISLRALLMRVLWSGIGAGLLCLPWFVHLYTGQIMDMLFNRITTLPAERSAAVRLREAFVNPLPYLPGLAWLWLPAGIVWGFWRRNRGFAIAMLWWFLILLATNPQWLGLPGSGVISNFTMAIAIYIPAALVAGPSLAWSVEALERASFVAARPAWQRLLPAVCALLVVSASLWGVAQLRLEITPGQHSLGTSADLRAAAWIKANLPEDTRFLVNSFPAFSNSAIVGSDGGWWLPLIAGRPTTQPPLPYTSEQGPFPDYRLWVNRLTAEIREKGIDHPDVLAMLQERGVTHVYVGQRQGSVNSDRPLIDLAALLASPRFQPVYHQDRVWIFALPP